MKFEIRDCGVCHGEFVAYEMEDGRMPTACQKCNSLLKARHPGVVEGRKCLEVYRSVKVVTDLPAWKIITTKTGDCFKTDIMGRQGGASWRGRIVIWARGFGETPPKTGDYVNVRLMESTIRPKRKTIGRKLDKLSGPISKQAWDLARSQVVEGSDMDSLVAEAKREVEERFAEELGRLETHVYVVLEPATPDEELTEDERKANLMLVFANAYSKTTLKGLGRQFHANLETENVVSVLGRAYGGARSGRFGTDYVLAVVSPDHPLIRRFSEGGQVTTTFYPPKEELSCDALLESA